MSFFKTENGLTLIEMLTAVAMLGITIAAISGLFISGITSNRKVLANQELIDQTSYALEYMSRALRMGRKDVDGGCIVAGKNYEITHDGNGIKFLAYDTETKLNICTEFFLDNGLIKKSTLAGEWSLTSDAFTINFIKFAVFGEDENSQPRVTVLLDVSGRKTGTVEPPRARVQTTISQRNLDM